MKSLRRRVAAILLSVGALLAGSIVGPVASAEAAGPTYSCNMYTGTHASWIQVCSVYTGPWFQTRVTLYVRNLNGSATPGYMEGNYISNGKSIGTFKSTAKETHGYIEMWSPTIRAPKGYAQVKITKLTQVNLQMVLPPPPYFSRTVKIV